MGVPSPPPSPAGAGDASDEERIANSPSHRERILDQFSKQAAMFEASHRSAEAAIRHAIEASEVTGADQVLDVACGPGVLACAFARVASHVTGIDITPPMLERARKLQLDTRVENVSWLCGDVFRLPFASDAFSMVLTRYSFHHLEVPAVVLSEMVRVCRAGGRVIVIDAAPPVAKAEAFDRVERQRDPSHTRALPAAQISQLMARCGAEVVRISDYAWEVTAESLLARSFPENGDRLAVMRLYEADAGVDSLGMNARWIDGVLNVSFPTVITVGRK